jgi:hypothetical protein
MVLMPAWFGSKPWWRTHQCQRFTAALDGKAGRDQQQSSGREVTDINAVRRSERD